MKEHKYTDKPRRSCSYANQVNDLGNNVKVCRDHFSHLTPYREAEVIFEMFIK